MANVDVVIHLLRSKYLQEKYGRGAIIGKFQGPIKLYRAVDGEELKKILDTGDIKGGHYSVAGERAHGASWGSDRNEVVRWAESLRGKRLGHELFLLEINGKGKSFFHLGMKALQELPEPDREKAGSQFYRVQIPEEECNTGLGCSLSVGTKDVEEWYVIEPGGKLVKTTVPQLKEQAQGLGMKARDLEIFHGVTVALPTATAQGISLMLIQREHRGWEAQRDLLRKYPKGKLPTNWQKALIKAADLGPNKVSEWIMDMPKAVSSAGKGDGERTHALVFKARVVAAAPEHELTLQGGYTLEAIWAVSPETNRLIQLWWGSIPVGQTKTADAVLLRYMLEN